MHNAAARNYRCCYALSQYSKALNFALYPALFVAIWSLRSAFFFGWLMMWFFHYAQIHSTGTRNGGVNPRTLAAPGFRSIIAPLVMLDFHGIRSRTKQVTSFPPTRTTTLLLCAASIVPHFPIKSSGGTAQAGSSVVTSSPQHPIPLSPTRKHSRSDPPFALHLRNEATSLGSANDEA